MELISPLRTMQAPRVGRWRILIVLLVAIFLTSAALWLITGIIIDFQFRGVGVNDPGEAVRLIELSGWNMAAGRVALAAFSLITIIWMLKTFGRLETLERRRL
jgi:hypothetical protein